MKHWLFFYDDIAETLTVIDYGELDQIGATFNKMVRGCSYVRQWTVNGMTHLDYGSHSRFFKVYPAVEIF